MGIRASDEEYECKYCSQMFYDDRSEDAYTEHQEHEASCAEDYDGVPYSEQEDAW